MNQLRPDAGRRTKIVCTLGPASESPETIEALIDAGMNVARINMSHGNHESHARMMGAVRSVAKKLGVYVPVLLDLSGPKMRIRALAAGSAQLRRGEQFILTSRKV